MSSKFLNLAKNLAQREAVGKIPFLPSFSKKTEPPYDFPIQIGDPRLREICEETNIMHYQDRSFLEDELAVKTVKNLLKVVGGSPASGLAAPQIGVRQRIFLFYSDLVETENGYADSDNTKIRIFVNPKILKRSSEMSLGLEGCLSVPILSGVVLRPKDIFIESYEVLHPEEIQASMKKIPLRKTLEKFSDTNSLIIQHEYDHLNGILFLDRIKNPKSYGDPFCLAIADGKEKSMEKRLAESAALNKNLIRGFILFLIAEVLAWKCYIEPKLFLSSI